METISDKNYGKIWYSDNSSFFSSLFLPHLTILWKETVLLHHTSWWIYKNAVKKDRHLNHTFCCVHRNVLKKKTKSKRQKKTETYITSFDVLTIILWKIPNFKSHFICWQSCCQKMNETCITLVWCVHNNVVKKYRHFYQTFFFVHNKVKKK